MIKIDSNNIARFENVGISAVSTPVGTMTNKKFCARLRKAKKLAVHNYPNPWCIYVACKKAKIQLSQIAAFDKSGKWENASYLWTLNIAKTKNDISAVFDNSIRNLGEEP